MHKLFYKNQWIKHGNNNSATYNLKIGPRGSFSTYDLFPRPFQKMCNAYWHISNCPLLKITYRLLKKISDEVSKVKKVKLLFYLALSMPVVTAGLFFYSSQPHIWVQFGFLNGQYWLFIKSWNLSNWFSKIHG